MALVVSALSLQLRRRQERWAAAAKLIAEANSAAAEAIETIFADVFARATERRWKCVASRVAKIERAAVARQALERLSAVVTTDAAQAKMRRMLREKVKAAAVEEARSQLEQEIIDKALAAGFKQLFASKGVAARRDREQEEAAVLLRLKGLSQAYSVADYSTSARHPRALYRRSPRIFRSTTRFGVHDAQRELEHMWATTSLLATTVPELLMPSSAATDTSEPGKPESAPAAWMSTPRASTCAAEVCHTEQSSREPAPVLEPAVITLRARLAGISSRHRERQQQVERQHERIDEMMDRRSDSLTDPATGHEHCLQLPAQSARRQKQTTPTKSSPLSKRARASARYIATFRGVPFYVSLSSPTSTATLTNTPLAATATALTSTRARAYPEISGLFSKRLQALVAAKPAHESGTAAAAGNIQMNAAFQRPAKARRADLGKLENVINGLFSGRRPATLLGAQPPVIAAQHEAQAGMVTAAKRPEMSAATDKRDNLVA